MAASFPRDPRLVLVPLAAGCGVAVGHASDASRWATLALLLEPLAWVAAGWAAYVAWLRRDVVLFVVATLGMASGSALARLARPPAEAPVEAPAWVEKVRGCARALALPVDAFRIVQWRPGPSVGAAGAVEAERVDADVVVLLGPVSDELDDTLRRQLPGEARRVDTPQGTVRVYTRGVLHACGDADQWVDVPTDGAATVVFFVGLAPASTLPLVVALLPDPLAEPRWDESAARARARLRAVVDGLASSLALVLVEGALPGPARRLQATLAASQLTPAKAPPTWPGSRLLPALHPYDRAWQASGWLLDGAELVRAPGASRAGLALAYRPAVRVQLPAPADHDPVR